MGWELPGGYSDYGEEEIAVAAVHETEEETGWRPRHVEFALSCQPLIGNTDYPQDLYLAYGAERSGEPEAGMQAASALPAGVFKDCAYGGFPTVSSVRGGT